MADYISSHSGAEIDSAVSAVADKVDKVTGKGLSTNDFTDTLKTLLELKKVLDLVFCIDHLQTLEVVLFPLMLHD